MPWIRCRSWGKNSPWLCIWRPSACKEHLWTLWALSKGEKGYNCNLKKTNQETKIYKTIKTPYGFFCISFCQYIIIYNFIGLRIIFLMSEVMIEMVQDTKQRLIQLQILSEVDIFASVYNVYNILCLTLSVSTTTVFLAFSNNLGYSSAAVSCSLLRWRKCHFWVVTWSQQSRNAAVAHPTSAANSSIFGASIWASDFELNFWRCSGSFCHHFCCSEALGWRAQWLFSVTLARPRLDGGWWKAASVVVLFAAWPGCVCVCKERTGRVSVTFQILTFCNALGKWWNIFLCAQSKPWQCWQTALFERLQSRSIRGRTCLSAPYTPQTNIIFQGLHLGVFYVIFPPGPLGSSRNSHSDQLPGAWWRGRARGADFAGRPLGVRQRETPGWCQPGRGRGGAQICAPRDSFPWDLQAFSGKNWF